MIDDFPTPDGPDTTMRRPCGRSGELGEEGVTLTAAQAA